MPQRWHGTFALAPDDADSQFWHIMSPPASNSSSAPPHLMQLAMHQVRMQCIYWFAIAPQIRRFARGRGSAKICPRISPGKIPSRLWCK